MVESSKVENQIRKYMGTKIGCLTLEQFVDCDRWQNLRFRCRCDCGHENVVRWLSNLIAHAPTSCPSCKKPTGQVSARFYAKWDKVRRDCCEEWHDYARFDRWLFEQIGDADPKDFTLKRTDRSVPNSPTNTLVISKPAKQVIEYEGEIFSVRGLCEKLKLVEHSFRYFYFTKFSDLPPHQRLERSIENANKKIPYRDQERFRASYELLKRFFDWD